MVGLSQDKPTWVVTTHCVCFWSRIAKISCGYFLCNTLLASWHEVPRFDVTLSLQCLPGFLAWDASTAFLASLRIKSWPPPPTLDFLTKDICLQPEPGRGKNCSHCNFQDFRSLTKGNQISLSTSPTQNQMENRQTLGDGGRIGILIPCAGRDAVEQAGSKSYMQPTTTATLVGLQPTSYVEIFPDVLSKVASVFCYRPFSSRASGRPFQAQSASRKTRKNSTDPHPGKRSLALGPLEPSYQLLELFLAGLSEGTQW